MMMKKPSGISKGMPAWLLQLGAATALAATFFLSCATTNGSLGTTEAGGTITVEMLLEGLEAGKYSGLAASLDGALFLVEQSGWRARSFRPGEGRSFEVALPSARCLLAGGFVHGFGAVDLVNRSFIRYDHNGSEVYKLDLSGHGVSAFCLVPSGEAIFLDADAGSVVLRDQGFRETRRWKLKGSGRPQAVAADLLEGLVAVSYPYEARLDIYSALGLMVGSLPLKAGQAPQTLVFDLRGRLWAALEDDTVLCLRLSGGRWEEKGKVKLAGIRALAAGPGGSVLALSSEGVTRLVAK